MEVKVTTKCCGWPMRPITLKALTHGVADTGSHAAYVCRRCGGWAHAYRQDESQLRAIVETRMMFYVRELVEAQS